MLNAPTTTRDLLAASLIFFLISLTAATQQPSPVQLASGYDSHSHVLDVPARYMWGWGPGLRGYCGETSFQMHGIYHGNWISSEEIRYSAGGKELLIAVNAKAAAIDLKYDYEQWKWDEHKAPQVEAFMYDFVRPNIDQGNLVVFGVYEELPKSKGDADYDHIVPCVGYKNSTEKDPKTGEYLIEGVYFMDLYLNQSRFLSLAKDVKDRRECLRDDIPSQPYTYCIPRQYDYAIALKGNVDAEKELVRFQLVMPSWTEPDWGVEDELHQAPVDFTLSGKAHGLVPGAQYAVYRFDNSSVTPTKDFADSSYAKKFTFTASSDTHTLTQFDTIRSDATVFYRCIRTVVVVNSSITAGAGSLMCLFGMFIMLLLLVV